MDSLTLFGHLFKTRCEAICIFLDFFTEKRGSHREIYDFFQKNHEMHCICKRFSIYCNKNCSGNMRILCPFAETTYTPSGDENVFSVCQNRQRIMKQLTPRQGTKTLCFYCTSTFTFWKQLTPRQGTKTKKATLSLLIIYRNNLHPVRGRKQQFALHPVIGVTKQLTPRQGTKTSFLRRIFHMTNETTYTPSGDEN